MDRFKCEGRLRIVIDKEMKEAIITLNHHHHQKYVDVHVPEYIKDYIKENIQQTPRQLWEDLAVDSINTSQKQVHFWWREYSKSAWMMDDNQVQSALKIIDLYSDVESMFHIAEDGITAIAFCIKEFIESVGGKAVEIAIDATCEYRIFAASLTRYYRQTAEQIKTFP